jgi:hypothetical protein
VIVRALKKLYTLAASAAMPLGLAAALAIAGCGTPGAPLPPSLKLPVPVKDLSASRTGNQVTLTWTMPRKTTDKLQINDDIPVRVCRNEGSGDCSALPGELSFAPKSVGTFTETLPAALAAGPPRSLTYFVELRNSRGRSAGLSNAATVLAGEAPAAVEGLTAQVRKDGVVLRWTANPVAGNSVAPDASAAQHTVIRLHRKLLTPEPTTGSASSAGSQTGLLAPPKELLEQNLLVESGNSDRTLDRSIRFGQTYEYRAQRVARVQVDDKTAGDKTLELAGPISDPVRVEALDVFPPAVPTGLAAVATAADSGSGPSIDLSWLPVTDVDLAGYAVYRREGDGEDTSWQRISPAQPVIGPSFHDSQVQPGHTYRYAVSAIDQLGHESARSPEAAETVPNQ